MNLHPLLKAAAVLSSLLLFAGYISNHSTGSIWPIGKSQDSELTLPKEEPPPTIGLKPEDRAVFSGSKSAGVSFTQPPPSITLQKNGEGRLVLPGSKSYTGITQVSPGTLTIKPSNRPVLSGSKSAPVELPPYLLPESDDPNSPQPQNPADKSNAAPADNTPRVAPNSPLLFKPGTGASIRNDK